MYVCAVVCVFLVGNGVYVAIKCERVYVYTNVMCVYADMYVLSERVCDFACVGTCVSPRGADESLALMTINIMKTTLRLDC